MNKATRTRILKKLERAKVLADEAFNLLCEEDCNKCDRFSGLICDVDEAIGEVNKL